MRKITFLVVVVLIVLVQLSCNFPLLQNSQGYIVYQKVDRDGEPLPELVVLDSGGKVLHEVSLPGDVEFLSRVPGIFNRYVIYQDFMASNRLFRLDVKTGEYAEYADFSLEGESVHISGYTDRWLLFTGSQGAYLLNNETGDMNAIPLEQDESESVGMIYPSLISPDKEVLIIYVNTGIWLVTLDDPENPRLIGGEDAKKVGSLSFSDDSKQITYVLSEDENSRIIRENLDGSDSEELLSGERILRIADVPEHDQLLIAYEDSVHLYSPKDGSDKTLMDLDDYIRTVYFDPDGKHASILWGGVSQETVRWSFIDLDSGEVMAIDDLDGLDQAVSLYGMKWAYITTIYSPDAPYEFYSLDLTTGGTRHLLRTELGASPYFIGLSSDGSQGLVYSYNGTEMLFWVLQAKEGKAIQLSDEDVAGAGMSASGRWVVFSEVKADGDERDYTVVLLDTKTGERKEIATGYSPTWVDP